MRKVRGGASRKTARSTAVVAAVRPSAKPSRQAKASPAARAASKPRVGNPLLERWRTPFAVAPFDRIEPAHFEPALARAFAEHRKEVKAIARSAARPTFANTVVALERSGALLDRISSVFWNLEGSCSSEALQEIAQRVSPKFAAHGTAILLDARLYQRIDALHERRHRLKLDDEAMRLLERTHLSFVRAGARLKPRQKKRVGEINARLATLVTTFMQNVLKDEQSWQLVLDGERDLAGLPADLRSSAAREAEQRGVPGKHVVTLARSSIEPFVTFSARRDLREKAWRAWISRGSNEGLTDNRGILAEIVALRAELARLLGYETFAAYALDDTMAKTPEAVSGLLKQVWGHARARAEEEKAMLAATARAEGSNAPIAGWDWRHYADKVRREKFALDESELRPYLQLEQMIAAAFDCANKLFGLSFVPREDVPRYHEDVRAWEVLDAKGGHVGLFLGDYFARASKRSGAWMSSFRSQHKLGRGERPIIVNVMSFARGGDGRPTLLSIDDARTLFHEFGHGLHGLLSDVTYPTLSGTSVSRDFVELPTQLYEHWLLRPEVLGRFALHHETGK
ncbi:MAG: M3 family metallopeptidase, partial [Hyphomicrobiaceae bacterium]